MNGPILGLPAAEYHAADYISSTKLMDLRPCPLFFRRRHVDKALARKESAALSVGTAAHLLILEGAGAYARGVVVKPEKYMDDDGTMKKWHEGATACKKWRENNVNFVIITQAEHAIIARMREAVSDNPEAAALLRHGAAEVTFRRDLGLFRVQCRADYWHPNGITLSDSKNIDAPVIVDLKTCESIERFERDFFDLRYHFRAEFYRLVVREVLAEAADATPQSIPAPAFFFVAVEKAEPFRCEVFAPTAEALEIGKREVHAALSMLSECYMSGEWPGSRPGVIDIGLTTWQERKSKAATESIIAT